MVQGHLQPLLHHTERNSAPCIFREDLSQLNPCCDGQTKMLKLLVLADWRPSGSYMYCSEAKCINNSWRHFWKSSRVVPDSLAVKQHERVGEGEDLFWYYFFNTSICYLRKKSGSPCLSTCHVPKGFDLQIPWPTPKLHSKEASS